MSGVSIAGPYSMHPFSACTAAMLARNSFRMASRIPDLAVMIAMTWITSWPPVALARVEAALIGYHRVSSLRRGRGSFCWLSPCTGEKCRPAEESTHNGRGDDPGDWAWLPGRAGGESRRLGAVDGDPQSALLARDA